MKYSDYRFMAFILNENLSFEEVFEDNYLNLEQVEEIIEMFDTEIDLRQKEKQFDRQIMNQSISVPVRIDMSFQHQIDKLQCIVNYQKMSSKYSEFRKYVGLQRQDSQSSNNSYTDGINLQQINNMIDFLASPLKLSPKKSYYPGIGKKSPMKEANKSEIKLFSSRKNSQVNETSDLTTNVDSQSISNHHIEKLPPAIKNIYRRHHTERQSSQKKIEITDMIDETQSRICFDFEKEQYLLDQNQQKEENQIQSAADDLRSILRQKLCSIQSKLNNKKINQAQMNTLFQKLNSLQALIDKF